MTKSKIFLYLCLSFIAGIFINSIVFTPLEMEFLTGSIPQLLMLGILILGLLLISVFWNSKRLVVIGFCLLFFTTGVWRHQLAELQIKKSELRKYNDSGKEIVFIGRVVKEPDIRKTNTKLTVEFYPLRNNLSNGSETTYFHASKYGSKERILVTTTRYPEYEYGDKLKIAGKLQTPISFEDFNYSDYLAKDGIYSVVYWPKIEVLAKSQGNFLYAKILSFKKRLSQNINNFLSPPQSSILSAMLLGEQKKMSEELKEKLNIVGLRHITAVSGMHVAILTNILMAFLLGIGFWRQQAFYATLILITLFIVLTGLQPSAVRAGIMGGFLLLGQHLGRPGSSSRAVVFAATLMLIDSPLLLRLDIGFQLSFLAVMGIIYLGPLFQNWFRFLTKKGFSWLNEILTMTFSAYLFTLPLLLYNFGTISLLAPLSNVLVLPFLPWLLALGFVMALTGLIWLPLAWLFSWPVWLLLSYVIKAIEGLSSFAFSSLTLKISWPWLFVSYVAFGFLSFWLSKRYRTTLLGRIN